MALIGKGIWKTDFDKKGLQSNALAGAILIIIGVSVLVGTFVPVDVWARIGLSIGIALLAIGSVFIAKRQSKSLVPPQNSEQK
jgi:hypothetical protein